MKKALEILAPIAALALATCDKPVEPTQVDAGKDKTHEAVMGVDLLVREAGPPSSLVPEGRLNDEAERILPGEFKSLPDCPENTRLDPFGVWGCVEKDGHGIIL